MKQPLLILAALLLCTNLVYAQSSTTNPVFTLAVPAYVQLDDAALPGTLELGSGLNPANGTSLTGAVASHNVTVLTNSSTGADLSLAITSGAAGGGLTTAWDNVSLALTTGAVTNGGSAFSGSSSGTFTGRTCTSDATCTGLLVQDIKGGKFTYGVNYTLTLTSRYALAGARSFTATYTVSL